MSHADEPIIAVAECLRQLQAPTAVIHVGAGAGTGPTHHWRNWGIEQAWLIDAQETRMEWAQGTLATHPGWRVEPALLGPNAGIARFHAASNPAESGLLPAEALASYWANLRTLGTAERAMTTLDRLITAASITNGNNWLIVDCCPALAVLEGGEAILKMSDVIVVRTLLDEASDAHKGATLTEIEPYLAERGFARVHLSEANHPSVALVVFARPVSRQISQSLDKLTSQLQHSELERARLNTQLDSKDIELQVVPQLLEQLDHKENDFKALEHTVSELRNASAKVKAHAEELAAQNSLKLHELEHLKSECAANAAQVAAMKAELSSATEKANQQTQLAKTRQEEIDAQAKQIVALEQAANDARSSAAKLKEQVNALNAQESLDREAMTKTADTLNAQLADRTQEIERLVASCAALDAQVKAKDTELTDMSQLREKLKKANEDLSELTAALDAKSRELADSAEKHKTLAVEHEKAAQAWGDEKATLTKAQTDLRAQITAATTEIDKVAKERADTVAQAEKLRGQCAELEMRVATLTAEVKEKDEELQRNEQVTVQTRLQQRLFEDEMLKAEAQIELIRDVLLKDGGL